MELAANEDDKEHLLWIGAYSEVLYILVASVKHEVSKRLQLSYLVETTRSDGQFVQTLEVPEDLEAHAYLFSAFLQSDRRFQQSSWIAAYHSHILQQLSQLCISDVYRAHPALRFALQV